LGDVLRQQPRNGTHLMLAYDYPVLGVFFTMLWFFLWVMWLFLLFRVIADIFRSDDLGGFAKVMWFVLVLFLPFLGVFIYVIARGQSMAQRDMERQQAANEQFRSYVRDAATTGGGTADELTKLADLRDRGVITEQEFATSKAKLLG
jgi:hypothetical protein